MKWLSIGLAALLALLLLFFAIAPASFERASNQVLPHEPYVISPAAARLHEQLVVADLHTDSALWNRDLRMRSDRGHVDLPRLREGNVAIQAFTIVTKSPAGQNYVSNAADSRDNITLLALAQRWPMRTWNSLTERTLFQAGKVTDIAVAHPEELRVLRTRADVEALMAARANGAQTVGALIGVEGAHALDADLSNIARLYEAGIRMVGLQHFFDNALGGSLHGQGGDGLSDFGREVVEQLSARGMIIDVAHSSEATVADVLDLTDRPLIVSHTGFQGNCATPRNISDALMQRIAAGGGLIGVGFWDAAVCDVSAEGIVAALRYGIDLVGADHVALGSDYDGTTTVPLDASELAVLTDRMLQAAFSEEEIRKVMGGNVLRFLGENLPSAGSVATVDSTDEEEPDYSDPAAWAVIPTDSPPGEEAQPAADVFYVHPTTYTDTVQWNASLETERALGAANTRVIARQSGSFSECCRTFVPWYRQASSRAFAERNAGGDAAYARAYADVLRAFDYFLAQGSGERPFILAGHSQGALHVQRILRERLAGSAEAERLVAAYAIGVPMPGAAFEARLRELGPCERADSTHCVVAWSTFLEGTDVSAYRDYNSERIAAEFGPAADRELLCVNPLTFDSARPAAPASEHRGALPQSEDFLPEPVAASVSARCDHGVLFVDVEPALQLAPIAGTGNMHFHDMGLFYTDISDNAVERVDAWKAWKQTEDTRT